MKRVSSTSIITSYFESDAVITRGKSKEPMYSRNIVQNSKPIDNYKHRDGLKYGEGTMSFLYLISFFFLIITLFFISCPSW
jgi:hypothetical protein